MNKILQTHKDKEKIEYRKVILSTFENETKTDVETALEVKNECRIISTSKHRLEWPGS